MYNILYTRTTVVIIFSLKLLTEINIQNAKWSTILFIFHYYTQIDK